MNAGDGDRFAREAWIRALQRTAAIDQEPHLTLPVLVDRQASAFGSSPALASPAGALTYQQLAARINRYARWGITQGLRAGDTAGLLLPNCAEYVAIWLGLSRLGVTVALLNTQLPADALAHCVAIAAPKLIIVASELASSVGAVRGRSQLPSGCAVWVHGKDTGDLPALEAAVAGVSHDPVSATECARPTLDSIALYIYTSGTTGLPKAAKVSHYRVMRWSQWFAGLLDARSDDRMYNCLPLYHSVGGVVAVGALLVSGGAVVIRPRFSVSEFWRDVVEERCTLFQYIGELCRYLLNAPQESLERQHSLRIACGNGLRPEVWEPFQARFGIPRILEYYASTEGNFSLYNCEGRPGAIGRIPSFLQHRLPVSLLRFDLEAGEPVRDSAGFCTPCKVDEIGEAVGLISETQRGGRFEGYADAEASRKKVLHNVFKTGDAWYRTGDLMRRDAAGFYYFVDRVGDTFRWKGENVSTAEVLNVVTAVSGVREGVVYGVSVPGTDGRAGMAALVVGREFDLEAFRRQVVERLPSYARPVFLRLLSSLETTGTFKPRKQELVTAGIDPAQVSDPLYFDDPRSGAYLPLDRTAHAAIIEGRIRL
jgi:fatty-acyl-CoA synthase